jgi:hypothetical protein
MNSCYLCHLQFCVISLLSQTHSASLYLHLFWRANQMSKSRRFVSCLGHFRYLMSLSQWFGEVSVFCPSCPTNDKRSGPLWGKVGETPLQWRPLLFLLRWFWELTNICFEIFFSSSDSFRSKSHLRIIVIEVFIILSFLFGKKCW